MDDGHVGGGGGGERRVLVAFWEWFAAPWSGEESTNSKISLSFCVCVCVFFFWNSLTSSFDWGGEEWKTHTPSIPKFSTPLTFLKIFNH